MEGRGEDERRTRSRRGRGREGADWAAVSRVVLVPLSRCVDRLAIYGHYHPKPLPSSYVAFARPDHRRAQRLRPYPLWFDPVDGPPRTNSDLDQNTNPCASLADIQGHTDDNLASSSSDASRDLDDIVQEDDLPFTRKKLALDKEEEQLGDIELGNHDPSSTVDTYSSTSTQSKHGS